MKGVLLQLPQTVLLNLLETKAITISKITEQVLLASKRSAESLTARSNSEPLPVSQKTNEASPLKTFSGLTKYYHAGEKLENW